MVRKINTRLENHHADFTLRVLLAVTMPSRLELTRRHR
jgi:hypothetical protein